MPQDPAALQARLAAGDWLQVGAIAALTGRGRTTVHEWLTSGRVPMRYRETLGGQRSYHPDDVRALVARLETDLSDAADGARARLQAKFKPGGGFDAIEGLWTVISAIRAWRSRKRSDAAAVERVGRDDALDALRLLAPARASIDAMEVELVDEARALGATWNQIGEALGTGQGRTASGRYERLSGRSPNLAGQRAEAQE